MSTVCRSDLLRWCRVLAKVLESHPDRKVPLRIVGSSELVAQLMFEELVGLVKRRNAEGLPTRAIVSCGPKCWYPVFRQKVRNYLSRWSACVCSRRVVLETILRAGWLSGNDRRCGWGDRTLLLHAPE